MCQYLVLMAGGRISFLPLCFLVAFLALCYPSFCRANNTPFNSIDHILEAYALHADVSLESAAKPAFLMEWESSSDPSKKILLSGEGGLAFFDTGQDGQFPNAEFRVDEAKLFVDASPGDDVYFYAELNLTSRESKDEFEVGELYADFENVSRLWNQEDVLSVRAGRVDIPFGEEYLTRDAIDNPLISHSLGDLWGVDEGVEVYGKIRKAQYVFAVQNGGIPKFRDYDSDKSLSGRLSFDLDPRFHLSASAMRTGALNVHDDVLSAMWFGNGFFRSLGSPQTTTAFHAELFEGDGQFHGSRGSVNAAAGMVRYGDNDTAADNSRDVSYYQVGGVVNLIQEGQRLYTVAQYSRITADKGFPLVGNGNFGEYFFDSRNLTQSLWRLSLGIGFYAHRNVLLKTEYSFERGKLVDGSERNEEDFVGVEAAVRF